MAKEPVQQTNLFTVLLDQREGTSFKGLKDGGAQLSGQPFYVTGETGLADSIDAIAQAGLHFVPTYTLVAGRAFAEKESGAWQQYHDSNAERVTVLDAKGILGTGGATYVLDIQNGGFFTGNPSIIREAVQSNTLVNRALQLDQKEVDAVLDAVNRKDDNALRELVRGERMAFAGRYDAFLEASAVPDFLKGGDATYVVVRPVADAKALTSDYQPTEAQKGNPDIIIASGGKTPAERMLDRAIIFGWKTFGAWHDGYANANTGRVVDLDSQHGGVYGDRSLGGSGHGVGVAPEARAAFYSSKVVDPLALKVQEAMKGSPVGHGDGVLLYVPKVQLKQ